MSYSLRDRLRAATYAFNNPESVGPSEDFCICGDCYYCRPELPSEKASYVPKEVAYDPREWSVSIGPINQVLMCPTETPKPLRFPNNPIETINFSQMALKQEN